MLRQRLRGREQRRHVRQTISRQTRRNGFTDEAVPGRVVVERDASPWTHEAAQDLAVVAATGEHVEDVHTGSHSEEAQHLGGMPSPVQGQIVRRSPGTGDGVVVAVGPGGRDEEQGADEQRAIHGDPQECGWKTGPGMMAQPISKPPATDRLTPVTFAACARYSAA